MGTGRAASGRGGRTLIDATLAAAGISRERCGVARTARLGEAQRELYEQVLRTFAANGRPSGAWVRGRATALGLEPDEALDVLRREDLIHLDADHEIAVAYPFSGRPTRHEVNLASGQEVRAMCAIDALGMAAMLGESIEIRSSDPVSEEPITVALRPNREPEWQPSEAVMIAGRACASGGPSYQGCCDVLNFFTSRATAERYLAEHPHVQGYPITIPEAVAAGNAIFGAVLGVRA